MTIDRIEAAPHRRGRILVWLSDGSQFAVTQQELQDFSLAAGDEVAEETLRRLKEAAGLSAVKAAAAEMIGRRAMSRRDLERKLREKGAGEDQARQAGQWLEDIGALDDAAYAAALVRHCADLGYGPARMRSKLYEKGVPRTLWEEAMSQAPGGGAAIDRFLKKKLQGRLPEEKEKRRLSDTLARRGFSWEEIRSAWGRLQVELPEE